MHSKVEKIEKSEEKRYAILPIRYHNVWSAYKHAQESFWVEDEINKDLETDKTQWPGVDPKIQNYLKHILGSFAVNDGLVNDNIRKYISDRIKIREILFWLDFQQAMEDIHNIVYSILIDTYITNESEKAMLLDSDMHYPSIRKKIQWVKKWLKHENEIHRISDNSRNALLVLERMYVAQKQNEFADSDVDKLFSKLHAPRPVLGIQIFINAIMEGIFFSSSFCAIFWIVNTYKILPGLAKANEFISRDEASHRDMWVKIYNEYIDHKMSETDAHGMIQEAVDIESEFICASLPTNLLGMNATLMTQYVKYMADDLLKACGYKKYFNVSNPFSFMEKQTIASRFSDFFVKGVSEYGKAYSANSSDNRLSFEAVEYSDEDD
jgi:ribonucleoside-diphosphate reductase beta chain